LLHRAVQCGLSEDVLRFLINKGLLLDQEDVKEYTALDVALSSFFTESFKILIEAAACRASPTFSVKFYNRCVKDSSDSDLITSFQILEGRHQQIRWRMSLERCLPIQKPKIGGESEVILGARERRRFLPDSIRQQILTDEGNRIAYHTSDTNHMVSRSCEGSDVLLFKVYPDLPGLEAAVRLLTQGS